MTKYKITTVAMYANGDTQTFVFYYDTEEEAKAEFEAMRTIQGLMVTTEMVHRYQTALETVEVMDYFQAGKMPDEK